MKSPWARLARIMDIEEKRDSSEGDDDIVRKTTDKKMAPQKGLSATETNDPPTTFDMWTVKKVELEAEIKTHISAKRYTRAIKLLTKALKEYGQQDGDQRGYSASDDLHVALALTHLAAASNYGQSRNEKESRQAHRHLVHACSDLTALKPHYFPDEKEWSHFTAGVQRLRAIALLFENKQREALDTYPKSIAGNLDRHIVEPALISLASHDPDVPDPDAVDSCFLTNAEEIWQGGGPFSTQAAETLGAVHWLSHNWGPAVTWMKRAFDLGCTQVAQPLSYAALQAGMNHPDIERAEEYLTIACTVAPKGQYCRRAVEERRRLRLDAGLQAWDQLELDEAERHWRKAWDLGSVKFASLGIMCCQLTRKDWEQAYATAVYGLEHDDEDLCGTGQGECILKLHLGAMVALVSEHRLQKVRYHVEEALNTVPGDVYVESLFGIVLLALGEIDQAYEHLVPLAHDTGHPTALQGATIAARAREELNEAEDLLGVLIRANQQNAWTRKEKQLIHHCRALQEASRSHGKDGSESKGGEERTFRRVSGLVDLLNGTSVADYGFDVLRQNLPSLEPEAPRAVKEIPPSPAYKGPTLPKLSWWLEKDTWPLRDF